MKFRTTPPGKTRQAFAALSFLLFACGTAVAEIELPAIFTDGMVLQRNMPVKVWGWANSGERVVVRFRGQKHTTLDAGHFIQDNQGEALAEITNRFIADNPAP